MACQTKHTRVVSPSAGKPSTDIQSDANFSYKNTLNHDVNSFLLWKWQCCTSNGLIIGHRLLSVFVPPIIHLKGDELFDDGLCSGFSSNIALLPHAIKGVPIWMIFRPCCVLTTACNCDDIIRVNLVDEYENCTGCPMPAVLCGSARTPIYYS